MNEIRASIAQSMAGREHKSHVHTMTWHVANDAYEGFLERAKVEQEASAFFSRLARQAMGIEKAGSTVPNTIAVPEDFMKRLSIKTPLASEMSRDETARLMSWCDFQDESLWDGMSLQEILNVYRASAEWVTWEDWADEDWESAYEAWNGAVVDPGNIMIPRK